MTSPPSCPPTTDSPLSTTASIVGILTFALGIFASYVALHTSTRSAPTEIARLIADLRSTQHEINRVAEYIFADYHSSPNDATGAGDHDASFYEEVQVLLKDCNHLFYEADGCQSYLSSTSAPQSRVFRHSRYVKAAYTPKCVPSLNSMTQRRYTDCILLAVLKRSEQEPERLWKRVQFLMRKDEVGEKMARLTVLTSKLSSIQISLFLKYVF